VSLYKSYSEYKDSGVDWLGVVPEHWNAKRAKYLFQRKQRPVRDEDEIVTAFRDGEVTLRKNRREDGFTVALKETGYQGVRKNDLVIHAMDAFAGAVGVSDSDGKCSPVYSCCEAKVGVLSGFYGYLVRTMSVTGFIESLAKGIRERSTDFRWADFSALELPLPTFEEQRKIVAYLDRETARVDALIEKKQRQIELLKEKRQAIITQAVTKGLDPDVPMKDSGVEWLGEVPEHWTTTKLKYETSAIVDCLHSTPNYTDDGDFPAIRTADISPGILDLSGARRVSQQEFKQRIVRLPPREGDVIYSREGERYGMAALVPDNIELCLGQRVMMFRAAQTCDGRYLMWLLNSTMIYWQAQQDVFGATSPHVNVSTIKNFTFPLPSISEQLEIGEFIDSRLAEIDSISMKTAQSIDLLKERRSALITAAVTGQIDVREEV